MSICNLFFLRFKGKKHSAHHSFYELKYTDEHCVHNRESCLCPRSTCKFFFSCCPSCMQCMDVCLHNDSWFSCSGGLRSWERHEAIIQRCVLLSGPDAPVALRLGQPGSGSVLNRLCRSPAAFRFKTRGVGPLGSLQGIPEEPGSTLF